VWTCGAVYAYQGDSVAAIDGKADILENLFFAVAFGDALEFGHGAPLWEAEEGEVDGFLSAEFRFFRFSRVP